MAFASNVLRTCICLRNKIIISRGAITIMDVLAQMDCAGAPDDSKFSSTVTLLHGKSHESNYTCTSTLNPIIYVRALLPIMYVRELAPAGLVLYQKFK
jgi:hypothetical protein